MSRSTRRRFLQTSTIIGLSAIAYTRVARAVIGQRRPVIGLVGCGGRSKSLYQGFIVVVQDGTQSRTNPLVANAIQMLREGAIGDVLMAKGWNVQRRQNIGHAKPASPPAGVDYDTTRRVAGALNRSAAIPRGGVTTAEILTVSTLA